MTDVAVVILAGGEGRRIGGSKPLRRLEGSRLIDRALDLAWRWSNVVAVAVRCPSQGPSVGAELVEDEPIEGPLGGLGAGLKFARANGCALLLTVPADMPFLPPDLLDRLTAAIGDFGCAMASSGGHPHPVSALWRASTLARLDDYVSSGRRSLKGFAGFVGAVEVEWPAGPNDPFFNINSADDLAEAEKRLLEIEDVDKLAFRMGQAIR
jgi:molybdopterin-guanine dinucleotide biosynthesis protein A